MFTETWLDIDRAFMPAYGLMSVAPKFTQIGRGLLGNLPVFPAGQSASGCLSLMNVFACFDETIKYAAFRKKHPLVFCCITLRKINQFE